MFTRQLNQCFSLKRRLFCENQPIFAVRLPIDFFYFEDFQWSFFGKTIGQKQRILGPRTKRILAEKAIGAKRKHVLSKQPAEPPDLLTLCS